MTSSGARSHAVRAARWEDFDLTQRIWTIAPEMQNTGGRTGESYLVPLSKGHLEVLNRIKNANEAACRENIPWPFPAATASCEGTHPIPATWTGRPGLQRR